MIRKTLLALTVAAAALASVPAAAQQTVGDWNLYSLFNGNNVGNIIDTKDKVFMLTAQRLFAVDKKTNETFGYTTRNKLSDTNISQIYLDPEEKRLLIAYDNGNIDILDIANDRITNMGDIADATLTSTKGIRTVLFHGDKIYVGTDFGMVVFDGKGYHVIESGIYNTAVDAIAVYDDKLLIHPSGSRIRITPLDGRHNTLTSYPVVGGDKSMDFMTVLNDGNIVFYDTSAKTLKKSTIRWGDTSYETASEDLGLTALQPMRMRADGSFDLVTSTALARVDADGNISSTTLPAPVAGQKLSAANGAENLWAINLEGYANYSVTGDNVTVLADKARPEAITTSQVAYIVGSKNGEKIYISNLGDTRFKSIGSANSAGSAIRQTTDVLTNGVPADASVFNARMVMTEDQRWQTRNNNTGMYGGCQRIVVDPENPNRYVVANFIEGVFVVENNEEVGRFLYSNMPTYSFWSPKNTGAMATDVIFDPEGNLWVGCWTYQTPKNDSPYTVLPRDKFQGDLSAVTKADWQTSKHAGVDQGGKDMGSIFSSISNMFITWHSVDSNPLGVTDTKGTYANTSDDTFTELINLTDQDGKAYKPTRWICAAEDKRGRIWFGSTSGVVEMTNPAKALDPDFHINRIKVPRNDGTNFADYLLESEQVNCIAVDASNRKWIATENSGVYLVSEDGDKILENFTTQNSGLPSNTVYSVYCDPNSNVVYFGLGTGLVTYNSTSSPAADNFDNVYAYPNPVRPDYTGWITIKGLKDNSLVKIADSAGSVLYQTRSEGGMVVWDGCNTDGTRVRSGVYFVFASQADGDETSGAVTKIMVIN